MAKTEVVNDEPEHPKFNEASSAFVFPVRFHYVSSLYVVFCNSLLFEFHSVWKELVIVKP